MDALGIIDVHVPPLDPLPRLWDDVAEGIEPSFEVGSERIVVVTPREVTSQRGTPISIAPTAASIDLLSSRPPRAVVQSESRALASSHRAPQPARWRAEQIAIAVAIFVVSFSATIALVRAYLLD